MNLSEGAYKAEIREFREERADFFRTSKGSPFIQNGTDFPGLAYYDINDRYRIAARLNRMTSRETIRITNSDGTVTTYLKFALAEFNLEGKECRLLILKSLGFGNQYLLAFGDDTSGEETYGGGRYLDVEIGKSDQIKLDFNKAYNPYCAYFGDFKCPLPPRENLLQVAIKAGEKNYPY